MAETAGQVWFLNPNSSAEMTAAMVDAARAAAPDLAITGWTNHAAPAAIEGPDDADRALPGLLEQVERLSDSGAIVIACFDDPGLAEARARARCPVIGAGEAALTLAALAAAEVGVITTVAAAVPVIRANIARMGLAGRVHVRAAEVPVLSLEREPEWALDRFAATASDLRETARVGALVAGCAGAAALRPGLSARSGLPVFDGVTAAAGLCRLLAAR